MRGSRFALLAPGAVMALMLPVMVLGVPAGTAGAISNACSFSQYPNAPGGMSGLAVNCTFATSPGSSETVEDYPQAVWHDGASWQVKDGVTTSGSATITSASAHFNAATDINHTVSGPNTAFGLIPIPADSFIIAVNSPTSVTLNHNATASKTAVVLTINNSTTRPVTDG